MKRMFSLLLAAALMIAVLSGAFADDAAQGIELYLEENTSTGYVWTVSNSDEAVVRAENVPEAEADVEEDHGYGESGTCHLRLSGEKAGTAYVRFTYARPWESVQPLADLTLAVTVDDAGTLLTEISLAAIREDSWHCSDEERLVYDPEAHAYRLALQDLPDGQTRMLAYEADSPRGFAFDFLTENGVTRLCSVHFYLYALPEDGSVPFAPAFLFTTTDRQGNVYTEQIFGGQKLTILNFWEPWCGPCVHEMPYLERLMQEYAGDILILGIYSTPDVEEDVEAVLKDAGVTFPILHYTNEFDFLQTGYVPTTVVIDQSGAIVQQPFAGSLRYDRWAKLVEDLL